ncbi:uncharacterized protein LOC141691112 [Apium graveolens]|uniref:uncharacterized protein LOC141691112 n=1 Tax=Apium graveolens TaxID=4045 RepID=UPI003D795C42
MGGPWTGRLGNQGRKRKTLFSYFPTSNATLANTPSVVATSNVSPNVTPTTTPNATVICTTTTIDPTATVSITPITSYDLHSAPAIATATPSALPTSTTSPIDLTSLERDPGLRRPIWKYPPNVRDDIRREYIRLEACQPKLHKDQYPPTEFGNQRRRFQASWFNSWPWLEYSVSKDAAFYFPHIDKVINSQSLEDVKKNRLRLRATIEAVQYLSLQACALRGHDESSTSRNRGNLIEMIKVFGRLSVDISNVVLENTPKNAMYTSPKVQKDILYILTSKIRNIICEKLGDSKFCILVDESIDASYKEQMAIVIRFVDVHGIIRERFFDIVNVANTTSLTLKKEISNVLTRNNLSIHNMRGQGYDGASNIRGAFNGLQALFLKECPYAYYVHCFAHRLQLALVGAAEKQDSIWEFFSMLSHVVNIVTGSSKRLLELQNTYGIEVDNFVASEERETGRGLNQIGNLQ